MTALKRKWSGFEFVQMIFYRRWKSHHLVERAVRTVSARSQTLPWEPGMRQVTDTSMGARYEQGHGSCEIGMSQVTDTSMGDIYEPGMSQVTDTSMGARYEKVTDISMGAMPGHGHFHGSQVRAGFTANSIGARYEPGHGNFHESQV
jgi:hypothetical protein